jgi:hypothetical protein
LENTKFIEIDPNKKTRSIRPSETKVLTKLARNKTARNEAKAFKDLLQSSKLDMWTKIRMVRGVNPSNTDIKVLNHNGQLITTSDEIGNSLNGSNLNKSLSNSSNTSRNLNFSFKNHENGFLFCQTDVSTVANVLSSLNDSKNGGVEQVPSFVYKILEPLILAPLTHIINLSISTNCFPNSWKKALVIPIYKGGDPALPGNYRPISLLPILSKVFEKISLDK